MDSVLNGGMFIGSALVEPDNKLPQNYQAPMPRKM
jgi:hypothetical protein